MTNLVANIEARLAENKTSIKSYVAYDTAAKVGVELSKQFNTANGTDTPVQFIPVCLPSTGRWSVVFNLTNWSAMANTGCYLGWFAQKGFFSI